MTMMRDIRIQIEFTLYHSLDGFVQDIGEGESITLHSIEGIQVS